ncbi:hypothetical protein [Acinetobacter baumannii]|uniref:hypothetical protein n=1 Tax=Acinetobacter baumannii TaxID=470 RepID=UPI00366D684E
MIYSIIQDVRNPKHLNLVSTDNGIDVNSKEEQDFWVVNGHWNGVYKDGHVLRQGNEWVPVNVYNDIQHNGDYNETFTIFEEEMGL